MLNLVAKLFHYSKIVLHALSKRAIMTFDHLTKEQRISVIINKSYASSLIIFMQQICPCYDGKDTKHLRFKLKSSAVKNLDAKDHCLTSPNKSLIIV